MGEDLELDPSLSDSGAHVRVGQPGYGGEGGGHSRCVGHWYKPWHAKMFCREALEITQGEVFERSLGVSPEALFQSTFSSYLGWIAHIPHSE